MNYFRYTLYLIISLSILSGCRPGKSKELASIDAVKLKSILESNLGNDVILHYWATWCTNCKPGLKSLGDLQKRYHKENFKVIAVSVDDPGNEIKRALVQYLYAESGDYAGQYIAKPGQTENLMKVVDSKWAEVVPLSYLINQKGSMVKRFIGARAMQE